MAGAGDRSRFYLEQSVPELQELLRKKIFNKVRLERILYPAFLTSLLTGRSQRRREEAFRLRGYRQCPLLPASRLDTLHRIRTQR
jgi:hypothetical protein